MRFKKYIFDQSSFSLKRKATIHRIHFFTFLIRYRIKIVLEYEYEYEFLRVNVYKTELTFFRIENCEFFSQSERSVCQFFIVHKIVRFT